MRSITTSFIALFYIFSIGILPTFAGGNEDIEGQATALIKQTLTPELQEAGLQSNNSAVQGATEKAANSVSGNGPTYVYTTESVPGGDCVCYVGGSVVDENQCKNVTTRQYRCTVGSGLQGFEKIFRSITGYLVKISILLGVLAIVMFGIGWALLGGDEENTKKLKKYAVNLLVGLTILFLFSYILGFLAPWIFHN